MRHKKRSFPAFPESGEAQPAPRGAGDADTRFLFLRGHGAFAPLAEALQALSPRVYLGGNDSAVAEAFVEIGCSRRALGGEGVQQRRASELAALFLATPRGLVVDEPLWARALAERFGSGEVPSFSQSEAHARLLSLPVDSLLLLGPPALEHDDEHQRKTEQLVEALRRVGVRSLGAVAALEGAALQKRFGAFAVRHWYALHRRLPCPLQLFVVEPTLRDTIDAEELPSLDALLFPLAAMLERFEARLRGRKRLAQRFHFHIRHEQGECTRGFELALPQADATRLFALLREWLSAQQWPAPLLSLTVTIDRTIPATPAQLLLWEATEERRASLGELVNRFRARYGEQCGFPQLLSSHLPEHAYRLLPQTSEAGAVTQRRFFPDRPLFLFEPPREIPRPSVFLELLETLDAEWWRPDGRRRYYRSVDARGRQQWVFEDRRSQRWFLHGVFF